MEHNNDKPEAKPQEPVNVHVDIKVDMQHGLVILTEDKVGGIVMVDPKQLIIPAQSIIAVACQIILAQMGVRPGQALEVKKDGSTKPVDDTKVKLM